MQGRFVERNVRPTVVEALREARAVCLLGARQSGKSTLARAIAAREHPAASDTRPRASTRPRI
jgi:predicted AAA+ superfamily ATPase